MSQVHGPTPISGEMSRIAYTLFMADIESKIENEVMVHRIGKAVSLPELANFIETNIGSWVGRPVLWDLSRMALVGLSVDSFSESSKVIAPTGHTRKGEMAAVVVANGVQYSMVRMHMSNVQKEGNPVETRIFWDFDKAVEWLTEPCKYVSPNRDVVIK